MSAATPVPLRRALDVRRRIGPRARLHRLWDAWSRRVPWRLAYDELTAVLFGALMAATLAAYLAFVASGSPFAPTGLPGWGVVAGGVALLAVAAVAVPARAEPIALRLAFLAAECVTIALLARYDDFVVSSLLLFAVACQSALVLRPAAALAVLPGLHAVLFGPALARGTLTVGPLEVMWSVGVGFSWAATLAVSSAIDAAVRARVEQRELARFLPAEAVERVLAGDALALRGERRTVTVLFADLRGSTTLAEAIGPEATVALLNEYLGAMAGAVFEHGGMLDKFLGDGLMAVFGVLDEPTRGAAPAVRAALAMRARIAACNEARVARGEAPIGFGVGIHTGEVVLGAIGTTDRRDFTAIGDAVNTAARLEKVAADRGVDIVVSEATATRAGAFDLVPLGDVPIRGRKQPVAVSAVR